MMLLDTHIWVWWLHRDKKLPELLKNKIESADVIVVSAASIYELSFLVQRERINLTLPLTEWLHEATPVESNVGFDKLSLRCQSYRLQYYRFYKELTILNQPHTAGFLIIFPLVMTI